MSPSTTADQVFAAALGLPLESRAALAEKLLKSLDSPDRAEIDQLFVHRQPGAAAALRGVACGALAWQEVPCRHANDDCKNKGPGNQEAQPA